MNGERMIYDMALKKWGMEFQINMTIEECSELITALSKLKRKVNSCTSEQVCNEIADVEIMIEQLKTIFPSNQIERFKLIKLKRLERMVKE